MSRLTDPTFSFFIVLLVGIVAGWLAQTVARTSWLSKQITGAGRVYLTSALVGVAGSFIGFHLATLLALSTPGSFAPFIAAAAGAAVILFVWRTIRI
jgi:uncharacterized membrane protein YeaQ/YmgE (transglycosylase-associated protein family)